MPHIPSVRGHVDDGAGSVAVVPRRADAVHQLSVARADQPAVHARLHALAGDLRHVAHAPAVQVAAAGRLQGAGDRMVGQELGQGGHLQQILRRHLIGVDGRHVKAAVRERARLVKDHDARLGQGLQVIAALDEDAAPGCAADAAEEAERNRDDQRARTGDDQKRQRAPEPLGPVSERQRRQHEERDGAADDGRRVIARELRDEVFGPGLAGARVFDQIENPGDGRLPEGMRDAHAQRARKIDAAADDLIAACHVARQRFAGQRRGVQRRDALQHRPVQRHPLPGLHHDHVADAHLFGIDLLQPVPALDVCVVGPYVHQRGDGAPRPADGISLEQLSDLIEEHHGDRLRVFAQRKRADRGDGHEKVLVKYLSAADVARGAV